MSKRIKRIIGVGIIIVLALSVLIFFYYPIEILSYKSKDGIVTVSITTSRKELYWGFEPKYNLVIKKEDFPFDKTILKEAFYYNELRGNMNDSSVNVQWEGNYVIVDIISTKGECIMHFETEY